MFGATTQCKIIAHSIHVFMPDTKEENLWLSKTFPRVFAALYTHFSISETNCNENDVRGYHG